MNNIQFIIVDERSNEMDEFIPELMHKLKLPQMDNMSYL